MNSHCVMHNVWYRMPGLSNTHFEQNLSICSDLAALLCCAVYSNLSLTPSTHILLKVVSLCRGGAHLGVDANLEAVLRVGQGADAVGSHGAGLALGRRADQLPRLLLLLLGRRELPRQVPVVVRLPRAYGTCVNP